MRNKIIKFIICFTALVACLVAGTPAVAFADKTETGNSGSTNTTTEDNYDFNGATSTTFTYRSYLTDVWIVWSGGTKYIMRNGAFEPSKGGTVTMETVYSTKNFDGYYYICYDNKRAIVFNNSGSNCNVRLLDEFATLARVGYDVSANSGEYTVYWANRRVKLYPLRASGSVDINAGVEVRSYNEYNTKVKRDDKADNHDTDTTEVGYIQIGSYTCYVTEDQDESIKRILRNAEDAPEVSDNNDIDIGQKMIKVRLMYNGGTSIQGYRNGDEVQMAVGSTFDDEPYIDDPNGFMQYYFWGWTESSSYNSKDSTSDPTAKRRAVANETIKKEYTIPDKKSVTLYAVFDKFDPDPDSNGNHIHYWQSQSTYAVCNICKERYIAKEKKKCRICNATDEEEYYHSCVYSTVTFKVGGCPTHLGARGATETEIEKCTEDVYFPATSMFGGTISQTHEIIGWSAPGGTYPVNYWYNLDGKDGRAMRGDDFEVTAIWGEKTFRAKFVSDGEVIETRNVEYAMPYGTLPTVTKADSEFIGWYHPSYDMVINGTYTHPLYDDVTITARWRGAISDCTIHLNLPDSVDINDCAYRSLDNKVISVEYGKAFTAHDDALKETPSMPGLTFLGWYINDTDTKITGDSICTLSSDFVLNGRWEAKRYKFTLDPDGGCFF